MLKHNLINCLKEFLGKCMAWGGHVGIVIDGRCWRGARKRPYAPPWLAVVELFGTGIGCQGQPCSLAYNRAFLFIQAHTTQSHILTDTQKYTHTHAHTQITQYTRINMHSHTHTQRPTLSIHTFTHTNTFKNPHT